MENICLIFSCFLSFVCAREFYFYEGSTGTLLCGLRLSKVRWSGGPEDAIISDGTQINPALSQSSRLSITGDHTAGEYNLQITNIQTSDAAVYRCVGNSVGQAFQETHTLFIKEYQNAIYFYEGSTGTLLCGLKLSKVRWSGGPEDAIISDGTQINPALQQSSRLSITGDQSSGEFTLQIINIQASDAAVYLCNGNDGTQVLEEMHTLIIKVKLASVSLTPAGVISIEEGENKDFQCRATSSPEPVISWYSPITESSSITENSTVTSTLRYTGRKEDNTKILYCNASSDGTVLKSMNAILNIKFGPESSLFLDLAQSLVTKILGERLDDVRCSAVCNPSCQYQWTKPDNNVIQGDTLSILSVTKGDHGTFRCRAWNGIGDGTIELNVIVNYGPESITLYPNYQSYTSVENTSMPDITCDSDCRPSCTVIWTGPNGQQVGSSNVLRLQNIKRSQSGVYRCNAFNEISGTTGAISVNVTYGPDSPLELNPAPTTVLKTIGESYNVTCSAVCSPNCQYQWTKFNSSIIQGDTLSIPSVTKGDHGTFRCRAWNGIGERTIEMSLTVNYGPASITLSPDALNYTTIENMSIPDITCDSDCRPNCTVIWTGPNGQQVGSSYVLRLQNIKRTQAGVYRCKVANAINSITIALEVTVNTPATIISIEGFSTFKEYEQINITCNAIGEPTPEIVWRFDNKEQHLMRNKSSFFVNQATCYHIGTYSCEASNYLRKDTKSVNVKVICGPRFENEMSSADVMRMEESDDLLLYVVLVAYPKPNVAWFFKNTTLESIESFSIFRHVSTIFKPNIEASDFGEYFVSANNSIQSKNIKRFLIEQKQNSPTLELSPKEPFSYGVGIGIGAGISMFVVLMTFLGCKCMQRQKRTDATYESSTNYISSGNEYNELEEIGKDRERERSRKSDQYGVLNENKEHKQQIGLNVNTRDLPEKTERSSTIYDDIKD